ncbi:MAG: hypothetical protein ABR867_06445, partial [Nitrososphaerales archaeon]
MARISPVFSLVFVVVSLIAMRVLTTERPLDSLAAPNRFIGAEIGLAAIVFLICVASSGRVRKSSWKASLFGFLDRRIRLPMVARVAALLLVLVGGFVFAFFATIDELGGYSGPGNSLATYPALRTIYNLLGLEYFNSWKVGTAAFFFFNVAVLGLIVLLANRGLGAAIKDSISLFAAPALVIFELGLWYFAPEDMTWHVTMFLWIGGINDHGYRAQSLAAGVTYYPINNWLVLFVALLMVASRIPAIWSGARARSSWKGGRGVRVRAPRTSLESSRKEFHLGLDLDLNSSLEVASDDRQYLQ